MRPKKVILCVAADAEELSRRAFVLETWEYAVLRAQGSVAALEELETYHAAIDLVLVMAPLRDHTRVIRAARKQHREARVAVVSSVAPAEVEAEFPDLFLRLEEWSWAEVRERIRVMVARKRGPTSGGAGVDKPRLTLTAIKARDVAREKKAAQSQPADANERRRA